MDLEAFLRGRLRVWWVGRGWNRTWRLTLSLRVAPQGSPMASRVTRDIGRLDAHAAWAFLSKPNPPELAPGENGNDARARVEKISCGRLASQVPFWHHLGILRGTPQLDP